MAPSRPSRPSRPGAPGEPGVPGEPGAPGEPGLPCVPGIPPKQKRGGCRFKIRKSSFYLIAANVHDYRTVEPGYLKLIPTSVAFALNFFVIYCELSRKTLSFGGLN